MVKKTELPWLEGDPSLPKNLGGVNRDPLQQGIGEEAQLSLSQYVNGMSVLPVACQNILSHALAEHPSQHFHDVRLVQLSFILIKISITWRREPEYP